MAIVLNACVVLGTAIGRLAGWALWRPGFELSGRRASTSGGSKRSAIANFPLRRVHVNSTNHLVNPLVFGRTTRERHTES